MSHRYGIGIVGTGGIANIHAGDLIKRCSDQAVVMAAVDLDEERLDAFCERWSVPHRYPTVEAMLDTEQVDVVALCTPPSEHAAQAIACLERGITVLCEKPPAMSLAEMDAIAAAERAGNGRFAGVVQHRFGSGARTLAGLVQQGRLGRMMTAVCHTLWYRPDEYFMVPWRGRWEVEGGGPTLGHAIHQIDMLLAMLGPWQEVVAVADRRARPTDTEDVSAAIVTFADGGMATILNSLLAPRETSYLRFDFAEATVELAHLYGYADENWRVTPAPGADGEALATAWESGPKGVSSGHGSQYAAVFAAMDRRERPPVELAAIRPTMDLVTAIYASAFGGGPVQAGQIGPDSPFYRRMDGPGAPWPGMKRPLT